MRCRFLFVTWMLLVLALSAFAQITVTSSVPANGAVSVPLATTLSFTFNESLDTSQHVGNDGLCVVFLTHDPQDSIQAGPPRYSDDLHTIFFDLLLTANTDFVFLISGAFATNGDTLSMPYGLCYTTAADHGTHQVSGTVTYDEGPIPSGPVVALLNQSPFSQNHSTVLAGTVVTNPNGTYTVLYVRNGTYWPITARDMNGDGNMDSDVDLIGFYDPNHTHQPQSIAVTDGDLSNINMVLTHLNHWVTARLYMDSAIGLVAPYGNDFHLVQVQSNNDTVALDGTCRAWRYGFYSSQRQRSIDVYTDAMGFEVDTSSGMQYPPNILTMPHDFLDSDTIMSIVESHGGSQIRQQHNVLERQLWGGNLQWFWPQNPTAILWAASYSWQVDTTWDTWWLAMDLVTGQIIDLGVHQGRLIPTAERIELLPNYPNPFNPSTSVPFVLPRATHVELKVYDVQGREAATLVNATMSAGPHVVRFDASRLANGIYFCHLKAGNTVLTQKMLLIK